MEPRLALDVVAQDTGHLLGAIALVLSFVHLYQKRFGALISILALQGILSAAVIAWQAHLLEAWPLYLVALITLAANGAVIPTALHRLVLERRTSRRIETALGIVPSAALGAGVVVLSFLVAPQAQPHPQESLALALSVVLLGLLMMATIRNPLGQVTGYLSLQNGLVLLALSIVTAPIVACLVIAVLLQAAFLISGLFLLSPGWHPDAAGLHHPDRMDQVRR